MDSSEVVANSCGDTLKRGADYEINYPTSTIRFFGGAFAYGLTVDSAAPAPTSTPAESIHQSDSASHESGATCWDSLFVSFLSVPGYMVYSYGVSPQVSLATGDVRGSLLVGGSSQRDAKPTLTAGLPTDATPTLQSFAISGAKRFSVITAEGGASSFSQGIDLALVGELSPGLRVSGNVSDRGYTPAQGSANRIGDLDKVALTFESPSFKGQIGDISLSERGLFSAYNRRLSGASLSISEPSFSTNATVARTQGIRHTQTISGQNRLQGPYQLTANGSPVAVSPGSVAVWLDGGRLIEGASADFAVNYNAGQITFSPLRPIDSRSRIVADFEVRQGLYLVDYFASRGELRGDRSRPALGWKYRRESDAAQTIDDQNFRDSFRDALQLSGDRFADSSISTITASDTGSFIVASGGELLFVGSAQGTHTAVFRRVAKGAGEYLYRGAGEFVFIGAGLGEFTPRLPLVAPASLDELSFTASQSSVNKFSYQVEGALSRQDRNLYSTLDDNDNIGALGDLRMEWRARRNAREGSESSGAFGSSARETTGLQNESLANADGVSLGARLRLNDARFQSAERRDAAEFTRRFYLSSALAATSPSGSSASQSNQRLFESQFGAPLGGVVSFESQWDHLRIGSQFSALAPTLKITVHSGRFVGTAWGNAVSTRHEQLNSSSRGTVRTIGSVNELKLSARSRAILSLERDQRHDNYSGPSNGSRYWQGNLTFHTGALSWGVDARTDDTLHSSMWRNLASRLRIFSRGAMSASTTDADYALTLQRVGLAGEFRDQALVRIGGRFRSRDGRRNAKVGFSLSDEARPLHGATYVPVAPGLGSYDLFNNAYIPQVGGGFVEIEEYLGSERAVRRIEREFSYEERGTWGQSRWENTISEDLLDAPFSMRWLTPGWPSPRRESASGNLRHRLTVKVLPLRWSHRLELAVDIARRSRLVEDAERYRDEFNFAATANHERQEFFGGVGGDVFVTLDQERAPYGDTRGWKTHLSVGQRRERVTYSSRLALRRAHLNSPALNTARSTLLTLAPLYDHRIAGRFSLRGSGEVFLMRLQGATFNDPTLYRLTDNNLGPRGVNLEISAQYTLGRDVRASLNCYGRYSAGAAGRSYMKMEIVATL